MLIVEILIAVGIACIATALLGTLTGGWRQARCAAINCRRRWRALRKRFHPRQNSRHQRKITGCRVLPDFSPLELRGRKQRNGFFRTVYFAPAFLLVALCSLP